jgi:hypothetical protein
MRLLACERHDGSPSSGKLVSGFDIGDVDALAHEQEVRQQDFSHSLFLPSLASYARRYSNSIQLAALRINGWTGTPAGRYSWP